MTKTTRYPSYRVLDQQEHWDDHTRSIVSSRIVREHTYRFLTEEESASVRAIASVLTSDLRGQLLQYVVCHVDEKLASSIGEGQRKPNVPPAPEFIRKGLAALDQSSYGFVFGPFATAGANQQTDMLRQCSNQTLEPLDAWSGVPQRAFFKKMLTLTLEAYYSHPDVWSEIGYGGPAYPRGYVRADIGRLDPWEAKEES